MSPDKEGEIEEIFEKLRSNVETELKMLQQLSSYQQQLESVRIPNEKAMIEAAIKSLQSSLKLLNNSTPDLISHISLAKKLPMKSKKTSLERVSFQTDGGEIAIAISSKDREKLLKELSLSEDLLKKIRKARPKKEKKKEITEFRKTSGYLKLSNRFFSNTAANQMKKGRFGELSTDLRRANIDILSQTYVAMMFFSAFIFIFIGIFTMVFFLFFNLNFSLYEGGYLLRLAKVFWIPLAFPLVTFFFLYRYPAAERKSIANKINQELPFAVIHMSAIAGAGIEPSKIFQIIGFSEEYPNLRKEVRKILNQINLYGYDLVTALNNTSKGTPSEKLSELFSGLSTTISTGGDLSNYFNKRAETLMLGYRLDREKYTKVAETFMDIYISVVIATPMILLLLLVMLSVSGIEIGFTPGQIGLMIVFAVALINVIFLGVLHVKQPKY